MRSVAWRAAAVRIVIGAGEGGGAANSAVEGKIKGRTSRLGRSVVLFGFFRLFRTSRLTSAMCAPSNHPVISTEIAHRDWIAHEP